MRKIVVTEFMTLDGVIENPAWSMPYWNDEIAQFKGEEQESSDALLLGRVTYEGFAASWPGRSDPGADTMNNLPKYVISTTLETVEWNNSRLVKGDIVEELTSLKRQAGRDILVYGSGVLVQTLIKHDLVDRLRLLVYPVVVGQGQRLFADGTSAKLKLVEARPIGPGGVVALIYEPDR